MGGSLMEVTQIINLIMYFIIYSFFGWILESVIKTIIAKKTVNSGFLYGPFCPIYGIGAIIMLLFLEGFKNDIIILFVVGFLVLSIWEYAVGALLEKVFKTKYWDYTENFCNIKGRVCLLNSLFWGFLGVIFIQKIHPFIQGYINPISQPIRILVTVTIGSWMLIDFIVTSIKVKNIQLKVDKLKEITENIREKLEELKEISENKTIHIETIQQAIEDLKYKQTKIKRKLYRQTNRLRKAFPTMKSEVIEKIGEMLNLRENMKRKNR